MGNINISDLRPAGADLFLDSESYLNDLTEGEMTNIDGGLSPFIAFIVVQAIASIPYAYWEMLVALMDILTR